MLQDLEDTPGSSKPDGSLNPRIACKDKWRRIELIETEVSFWHEHEEARLRYQNGERGVLFPAGTYWLRAQFGVRCRQAA